MLCRTEYCLAGLNVIFCWTECCFVELNILFCWTECFVGLSVLLD
jgi:hypothetical protein